MGDCPEGFYGVAAILAKALAIRRHTPATEYDLQLLYFEDLPLGGEWTTRRRTISQADLTAFTGVAGDFNPLHVDEEHARGTHFGAVLVPAGLIASAAIGLGSMDAPVPATVGMLGMNWKFLKPVKVGDSICGRWRLARVRKVNNPAWGVAAWQVAVLNQRDEIVAQGEITRLVASRGASAGEKAHITGSDVAAADALEVEVAPRRRGRGRPQPETSETPLEEAIETVAGEAAPEPAPADVPSPGRRRRRGRGRSGSGAGNATAPGNATAALPGGEAGGAPITAAVPVDPGPTAGAGSGAPGNGGGSGRRRRRGRGRGGAGGGSGAGPGGGSEGGSMEPGPASLSAPGAPSAPAAAAPPAPALTPAGETAGGGRFGRVLRRLRGT